jgi:hypothetical protein
MDRVNLACSEAEEIRALFWRERDDVDDLLAKRRGSEYYLTPILLVRWWVRFGGLKFEDADLLKARRDMARYVWILTGLVVVGLAGLALAYVDRKH